MEILNLSEKNANLLKTLGIDRVLAYYADGHGHSLAEQKTESLSIEATKKELAETALQAHEELVQANDENLPRFKRVIDFLKDDLDRLN